MNVLICANRCASNTRRAWCHNECSLDNKISGSWKGALTKTSGWHRLHLWGLAFWCFVAGSLPSAALVFLLPVDSWRQGRAQTVCPMISSLSLSHSPFISPYSNYSFFFYLSISSHYILSLSQELNGRTGGTALGFPLSPPTSTAIWVSDTAQVPPVNQAAGAFQRSSTQTNLPSNHGPWMQKDPSNPGDLSSFADLDWILAVAHGCFKRVTLGWALCLHLLINCFNSNCITKIHVDRFLLPTKCNVWGPFANAAQAAPLCRVYFPGWIPVQPCQRTACCCFLTSMPVLWTLTVAHLHMANPASLVHIVTNLGRLDIFLYQYSSFIFIFLYLLIFL